MLLPKLFGHAWVFVVALVIFIEASFHGPKMKAHPTIGRLLSASPWVYVPLVVLVFAIAYQVDKRSAERLLEAGVVAPAVVTEVKDTGVELGVNPVFTLRVRVSPPEGAPFEAQVQHVPERYSMGAIQAGTRLTVRYDPRDHGHIAVVAGP